MLRLLYHRISSYKKLPKALMSHMIIPANQSDALVQLPGYHKRDARSVQIMQMMSVASTATPEKPSPKKILKV